MATPSSSPETLSPVWTWMSHLILSCPALGCSALCLTNEKVMENRALQNTESYQGPNCNQVSGYRNQPMNTPCTKISLKSYLVTFVCLRAGQSHDVVPRALEFAVLNRLVSNSQRFTYVCLPGTMIKNKCYHVQIFLLLVALTRYLTGSDSEEEGHILAYIVVS